MSVRPEFLIDRQGRTFALYAGILDAAHQEGLQEIRTTLIQIPNPENGNVAICQAEVRTEKGVFTGIADASPSNVARAMQTCIIRMAETRAKARALRDAVNIGVAALEELGPEDDAPGTTPTPSANGHHATTIPPAPAPRQGNSPTPTGAGGSPLRGKAGPVTAQQIREAQSALVKEMTEHAWTEEEVRADFAQAITETDPAKRLAQIQAHAGYWQSEWAKEGAAA